MMSDLNQKILPCFRTNQRRRQVLIYSPKHRTHSSSCMAPASALLCKPSASPRGPYTASSMVSRVLPGGHLRWEICDGTGGRGNVAVVTDGDANTSSQECTNTLFHEPACTLGTVPELNISDVLWSAEDLIQHSSRPVSESSVAGSAGCITAGSTTRWCGRVRPRPVLQKAEALRDAGHDVGSLISADR